MILYLENNSIFSQNNYVVIPEYKFLNLNLNKIDYPNGSLNFKNLYSKFNKIINGQNENINIVHIGGSHIQADIFPNKVRSNLVLLSPNCTSGRGFIFPYSIANTNNPSNYTTSYQGIWNYEKNTFSYISKNIGLSGYVVSTSDSNANLSIKINNYDNILYEFNSLKLIVNQKNQIIPEITIQNKKFQPKYFDDEFSTYNFQFDDFYTNFSLNFSGFDSTCQDISISGIILENSKQAINYHSLGVNGASVSSFLKCVNLENDILLIKPDLVIFSIGINDAYNNNFDTTIFINQYSELINRILKSSPNCAILFTTNNDSFKKNTEEFIVNNNGIIAREAFFKLAKRFKGGVWDLFSIMGGIGSITEWEKAGLAKKDKIHFTNEGYNIIGNLLYNSLLNDILSAGVK